MSVTHYFQAPLLKDASNPEVSPVWTVFTCSMLFQVCPSPLQVCLLSHTHTHPQFSKHQKLAHGHLFIFDTNVHDTHLDSQPTHHHTGRAWPPRGGNREKSWWVLLSASPAFPDCRQVPTSGRQDHHGCRSEDGCWPAEATGRGSQLHSHQLSVGPWGASPRCSVFHLPVLSPPQERRDGGKWFSF